MNYEEIKQKYALQAALKAGELQTAKQKVYEARMILSFNKSEREKLRPKSYTEMTDSKAWFEASRKIEKAERDLKAAEMEYTSLISGVDFNEVAKNMIR